jgi:hypothetical protein
MVVGTEMGNQENQQILGIKVVNEIHVLGITIDRKFENLGINWEKVRNKMIHISYHRQYI